MTVAAFIGISSSTVADRRCSTSYASSHNRFGYRTLLHANRNGHVQYASVARSTSRIRQNKELRVSAQSKGFGSTPSSQPRKKQKQERNSGKAVAAVDSLQTLSKSVEDGLQGLNVYLVGMMGSGKSTVGSVLASSLNYMFFDADAVAEQAAGCPISQIFEESGEDVFRDLETEVLKTLHAYKNCVIATGGGVVIRKGNWSYMQQGIVVWLNGSPELLAKRVTSDGTSKRPLLSGQEGSDGGDQSEEKAAVAKLQGIFEKREVMYRNADIEIVLDDPNQDGGMAVEKLVLSILKKIDDRIKEAAKEQEEKKKFEIVDESKGMRVVHKPFWDRIEDAREEGAEKEKNGEDLLDPEE